MKQLRPTFLLVALFVAPWLGASAAVTPLDDGFAEEAWERTAFSPCKGGDSIRKLEGGDYVHIFTSPLFSGIAPRTFSVLADKSVEITYLLVGGGGGGGGCCGGGGGGAQVVEGSVSLSPGDVLTVEVGRGGFPIKNAGYSKYLFPNIYMVGQKLEAGTSSGSSSQGGTTRLILNGNTANPIASAIGGGGGAYHESQAPTIENAGSGGNGASHTYAPGGGSMWASGGAPVAGDHAGNGADGCSTCIAGEIRYFGGGGGGGAGDNAKTTSGGIGGIGGGGNGTDWNHQFIGYPGEDGTGGGGGGGPNAGGYIDGGKGGDGIVILRYSGEGLTPVVNGCIDRTVEGEVTIGSYASANGPGVLVKEGAAQGGEIHQLSTGEFVHRFTQSGTFKAPAGESLTVDYLVVGGGGAGGGKYSSAGGGAGGVRYGRLMVPAGEAVTVTVGTGGVKGAGTGAKGGDSKLSLGAVAITTAHGGGGGTGWDGGSFGVSGGSGGGAYAAPVDFEEGTSGGYREVSVRGSHGYGVGGGGAGRMGCQNVGATGGAGGAGVKCAITGESIWYAGGGAGCVRTASGNTAHGGLGGSGIGGNGAEGSTPATNPKPNTGSGGGGGGCTWTESGAGSGASSGADGVVILRYRAYHVSTQWEFLGGVLMWTAKANAAPEDTDAKLYYAKTAEELDDLGACAFVTGDFVSDPAEASVRLVRWNLSKLDREETYFLKAVVADSAGSIASAVVSSTMPGYSAYSVGDGGEVSFLGGGVGTPPEVLHKFTEVGAQPFFAPSTLVPLAQFSARILLVGGGGGGAQYSAGGGAGVFDGTVPLVGGQTYSVTVGDGGAGSVYKTKSNGDDGDNTVFAGGATGAMLEVLATGGGGAPQTYFSGHGGGYVYRLNDAEQASREGVAGNSGGYGSTRGGSSMINASTAASNGNVSKGGDGPSSDISGEVVYYGGGGGSGRPGNSSGGGGAGGAGGGGTGGVKGNTYYVATPGVDGLGGGGGGGTYEQSATFASGARGGSGIAYIRYAPQPYDTSVPFGEVRELELQADGLVRLETYLYLLGDEATSAKVVLLWGGEGEELTNEIVLDESMIVTSASRVFYLDRLPFGTNLNFTVRFTNNDGVNEGKYSSTQQHPLAVPPLTLFEPVEPVVSTTNLTVTFTGEVAVVGYGSTTIQVRYGPERDVLIHTNKPVYQISYEMYGDKGPYSFATMDIRCDKKGDKMPTVYYVYDLLETAGSTNRVLQSWTSEVRKAKIYTPQGTTFGIR